MPSSTINFYETLGVERDATLKEIQSAYRKLARKWHPDANQEGDAAESLQRFKIINDAYHTLSDADRRELYDRQTATSSGATTNPGSYSWDRGFDDDGFSGSNDWGSSTGDTGESWNWQPPMDGTWPYDATTIDPGGEWEDEEPELSSDVWLWSGNERQRGDFSNFVDDLAVAFDGFDQQYEPRPVSYDDRFLPLNLRRLLCVSDTSTRFGDGEKFVVRDGLGVYHAVGRINFKGFKRSIFSNQDHYAQRYPRSSEDIKWRLKHPDGHDIFEVGDNALAGYTPELAFKRGRFIEAMLAFFTNDPAICSHPISAEPGAPTIGEKFASLLEAESRVGWSRLFKMDDAAMAHFGVTNEQAAGFSDLYQWFQGFHHSKGHLQSNTLAAVRSFYEPPTIAHALSAMAWELNVEVVTSHLQGRHSPMVIASGIDNEKVLVSAPVTSSEYVLEEHSFPGIAEVARFGAAVRLGLGLGFHHLDHAQRKSIINTPEFSAATDELRESMRRESFRSEQSSNPHRLDGTFAVSTVPFWVNDHYPKLIATAAGVLHTSALKGADGFESSSGFGRPQELGGHKFFAL